MPPNINRLALPLLNLLFIGPNKSVEQVTFINNRSFCWIKNRKLFSVIKSFYDPGATPKPLTKLETISILSYDYLTVSTIKSINKSDPASHPTELTLTICPLACLRMIGSTPFIILTTQALGDLFHPKDFEIKS